MKVTETSFQFDHPSFDSGLFQALKEKAVATEPDALPIRFVVPRSDKNSFFCEVACLHGSHPKSATATSAFDFRKRDYEDNGSFNVCMVIPTGVGCHLGGHAGDAAPTARLLAGVCDELILHPNVVNASDINEQPANSLYVEGSILSRVLMGTAGLRRVRANRILLLADRSDCQKFTDAAISAANAALASCGAEITGVVLMDPPLKMHAEFSVETQRACGRIEDLAPMMALIEKHGEDADAIAISSKIDLSEKVHKEYFESHGDESVNPWGGVEAMLTHSLSALLDIPTAHAPMWESKELFERNPGVVDARMAAEAVSIAFSHCIFKGLMKSPQIVSDPAQIRSAGVLSAENVHCLVIPDGCLGLPTLAALEQGIQVIAVKNDNVLKNQLENLPWAANQFHVAENYLEAAGLLTALREGVAVSSVVRPIHKVPVV